jgi:chemotaxis signal transduction protein
VEFFLRKAEFLCKRRIHIQPERQAAILAAIQRFMEFSPLTSSVRLLRLNAGRHEMALDAQHLVSISTTEVIRFVENPGLDIQQVAMYDGKVLPVADIGQPAKPGTQRPMLILQLYRQLMALIVDEVEQIVTLPIQEIVIAKESEANGHNVIHGHYVCESGIIIVIDIERLFGPFLLR